MTKEPYGSLYVKKSRYYARIHYYVNNERKTKDKATGVLVDTSTPKKEDKAKRKAEQKLAEFLAEFKALQNDVTPNPCEVMFSRTVEEWLGIQRGSKAPSTIAGYQQIVRDIVLYFTKICPTRTADLTSELIERYLNWERMRRQPGYTGEHKRKSMYADGSGIENTVKHRYTLIRCILQYAKRCGIVERNVASKNDSHIDAPRPMRHEFEVLDPEEAKQLLQHLDEGEMWFKTSVVLALMLGLRRSEIIGLRISDINFARKTITIRNTVTQQNIDGKNTLVAKPFTKNKKPKLFPMSDSLMDLLKTFIELHKINAILFGDSYDKQWDGYLMRCADGKLIKPNMLTREFSNFLKRHKLKEIRLHDLRHTCASLLFANGTDLMTIQEIMGHNQLTTTISYTHKISDQKCHALNILNEQLAP